MEEQQQEENGFEDVQQFQDELSSLQQLINQPNKKRKRTDFTSLCFQNLKQAAKKLQQRPTLETDQDDIWPTNAPADAKIEFLMSLGLLSPTSHPVQIANFIITLESLNSNEDGCMLYNIQRHMCFGDKTQTIIEINIAFCALLSPSVLVGTSFENLSKIQYDKRVSLLQNFHAQNVKLYRQIVEINRCRSTNRPLARLYEDPPIQGQNDESKLFDIPEPSPHQYLLEYLFQYAAARGLRKSENGIFQEVINLPEDVGTRFFVFVENFEKWAWDAISPKILHPYENWCMTYKPGTPRHIANMLANQKDPRLPLLKKRRTLFSYRNGIFDAASGLFHVFTPGPFLPPYIHTVDELAPEECTAQFFDHVLDLSFFEPGYDKTKMPVRMHRKILLDQHFDEETIECWNAMFGRTLHDSGSKDDFQVCQWTSGVTGTGKSKMGQNWANVYPKEDVGFLCDDAEQNFTDQHVRHANMILGLDVSEDLDISANRLYGWIASDNMVIKIKHQEAITMKWRAHLMFFSNVWPAIVSKSGAAIRRILFFSFKYPIRVTDTRLHISLKEELPVYLIQTALYYLEWVRKYGKMSLWENRPPPESGPILPAMCHEGKKEYARRISPPDAFLDSPTCEYNANYFCDVALFTRHYNVFKNSQSKAPQGPQRSRSYNPEVSQLSFAYPLHARNCYWDTEKKIITGLRCSGAMDETTIRRTEVSVING